MLRTARSGGLSTTSTSTATTRGSARWRSRSFEGQRGDWRCAERSYGAFARSLELPFEIDPEQVDANVAHGELHVCIGKPAATAGTRIDIGDGAA